MALPTRKRVNPVHTKPERAFTLVEVMVAAILVTIFFASIFELNAVCLRYIGASKESLAAVQSVQDRSETDFASSRRGIGADLAELSRPETNEAHTDQFKD